VVLAMRKHKIPGGRTAVWRFFKRHKITFKKKPARSGARARGRGLRLRRQDTDDRHRLLCAGRERPRSRAPE
jgi:hypothetical protein